ncbi:MAG: hypothetical protein H6556_28670, partial [Lewinellaceae bacterium]|nr:hypothetical protein [Lewinellaceae bacterium]
DKDGAFLFDHYTAQTFGATAKRFNRKGKYHLSKWTAPSDSVCWYFEVEQPQSCELSITFAAQAEWAGQPYVICLDGEEIRAKVVETGDWYEYQTFLLDTVALRQPGKKKLTIRPAEGLPQYLMYFKSMELKPL